MTEASSLTAPGRSTSYECCDPFAAGYRRRLGGYHPSTHAPTPATCTGQYGVDRAGSAGWSVDEPYLVVAWPRRVLAHSAGRCLALRRDNVDGVCPGIPFLRCACYRLCHPLLHSSIFRAQISR